MTQENNELSEQEIADRDAAFADLLRRLMTEVNATPMLASIALAALVSATGSVASQSFDTEEACTEYLKWTFQAMLDQLPAAYAEQQKRGQVVKLDS